MTNILSLERLFGVWVSVKFVCKLVVAGIVPVEAPTVVSSKTSLTVVPAELQIAVPAELRVRTCPVVPVAVGKVVPPAVNTLVPDRVSAPVTEVVPDKIALLIVLFVNVSVPERVDKMPEVGNVIFVAAVVVKIVLKLPEVLKFPASVIVLFPLFTPVPPYVGEITPVMDEVPSKLAPKILRGVCNAEAVLALPFKAAVMVAAEKLPLPSRLTKVLAVLLDVAAETVVFKEEIVEELTPPI